eukprot:GCRY01003739.1.p1 GENE.GCRY01003739.1~~GCRY01003739.1.p1  ORF type:complete len:250 (+),score=57.44 GCRY01003739.1:186-935(+)
MDAISMLDVMVEKTQKIGRDQSLNRIVTISSLTPQLAAAKQDLGAYYEWFFKQFHQESGTVTGLLLVLQGTCIHFVEASAKIIRALVRDLDEGKTVSSLIENTKILVNAEDIGTRKYPMWATRVIHVPQRMDTYDTEPESLESQVSDIYVSMLRLGMSLSRLEKIELKSALDSLRKTHGDLIPSDEAIATFLKSELLCSPREYLDLYGSTIDIPFDDERVWPHPTSDYLHELALPAPSPSITINIQNQS